MQMRHYKFPRITVDPEKCFGKPSIRDLRMPVAPILGYLSSGMSVEDIVREWPELEAEDIYQALGYAASAMDEEVIVTRGDAVAANSCSMSACHGSELA